MAPVKNFSRVGRVFNTYSSQDTTCEDFTKSSSDPVQSVQFSRSVMSNSLRHHGLQHVRPPCPSPTLRTYSNSMDAHRVSDAIQPCHPLSSPFPLPLIFPSIRIFPNFKNQIWGLQNWIYIRQQSLIKISRTIPLADSPWLSSGARVPFSELLTTCRGQQPAALGLLLYSSKAKKAFYIFKEQ